MEIHLCLRPSNVQDAIGKKNSNVADAIMHMKGSPATFEEASDKTRLPPDMAESLLLEEATGPNPIVSYSCLHLGWRIEMLDVVTWRPRNCMRPLHLAQRQQHTLLRKSLMMRFLAFRHRV